MPVAAPRSAGPAATSCELADIFQRYGAAYAGTHRLAPPRRKAIRDITRCRTAALGGHREWCDGCGFQRYLYHSCRNRHCPKCQTTAKEAWVAARQDELLPVPYFHNVFTLPHELNGLILFGERNHRALLKLLFAATAQTLLEFGRKNLGGKVGFTLVLHTWDQQLRPHFHLHLGRYTHRAAISNHRILSCAGGEVRFAYRDRRDGDRRKTTTLPADEFIDRFLKHVLPDGFMRIRHYGFLANRAKQTSLARCRELLGVRPASPDEDRPQTAADWLRLALGIDPDRCPCCGDTLFRESLPAMTYPFAAPHVLPRRLDPFDTS